MTSAFMAILFLIFAAGLPVLSLSVDAVQTESGNTPDSGTISDTFIYDGKVVKGGRDVSFYGGSVIYRVLPNTDYYVRVLYQSYMGESLIMDTTMYFFKSYPSAGSVPISSSDVFVLQGGYLNYHFTTGPNTYFVMLPLWSDDYGYTYADIRSLIESASVGDTLGLYTPLANQSTMNINQSFDLSFSFKFSASGGVGTYKFTAEFIDDSGNVEILYDRVPAGEYTMLLPATGDNDIVRITASDYLGNTSVKNFNVDLVQHIIQQLPPPEIDVSDIPDTSISVDNNFASIIVDTFDVFPTEITALLVPVVLFCLVGWWLHK